MKGLCQAVVATEHCAWRKPFVSSEISKKERSLFGTKEDVAHDVNIGISVVWGKREAHKTMEQLNNNHTFNLKQREVLSKLLAQAKERAHVNIESDNSVDARVQADVLPKLAEEHGAMTLVAKLRDLRKQVDELEERLQKLGFNCDEYSVSLLWNAPKALSEALDAAQRAAREERDKVLKKYDLAILDVWAADDVAVAKGIVEKLL